jgi:hypothetical protein
MTNYIPCAVCCAEASAITMVNSALVHMCRMHARFGYERAKRIYALYAKHTYAMR